MNQRINPVYGLLLWILTAHFSAKAQDLEPRAYLRIPVNVTVLTTGFSYSHGGVLTDPSLPLKNVKADIEVATVSVAHSFSLFGLTAQSLAVLPYSWLHGSASVNGQFETASRSGIGDMRFRISALLFGAPAIPVRDFAKQPPKTVLGMSLTIIAPTGYYHSDKLINIGASRWAFKPELALSHPFDKRWMLDIYAGCWFYTHNTSFYPGTTLMSQNPIGAFQGHLSYNVKRNLWAAFDATYYVGGNSTLNNIRKDNAVSNVRLGGTVVLPAGRQSSFRLAYSSGAYVLAGTNFSTYSVGWSHTWY